MVAHSSGSTSNSQHHLIESQPCRPLPRLKSVTSQSTRSKEAGGFAASQGASDGVQIVVLEPGSLGSSPGSDFCYMLGSGPVL